MELALENEHVYEPESTLLENRVQNLRNKNSPTQVHFVCAHGLGISGLMAMAFRDKLERESLTDNYDVFQAGYQLPEHMKEIRKDDYVFVASPFRKEVEKLKTAGEIKSKNVHYIDPPAFYDTCNMHYFADKVLETIQCTF